MADASDPSSLAGLATGAIALAWRVFDWATNKTKKEEQKDYVTRDELATLATKSELTSAETRINDRMDQMVTDLRRVADDMKTTARDMNQQVIALHHELGELIGATKHNKH